MPTGYMRVNLNGQTGVDDPVLPSAAEKALLTYLSGIPGSFWFDHQYDDTDASNFIMSAPGWLNGTDGTQQLLTQSNSDDRPLLDVTTDGQYGARGRTIGVADRGTLKGSTFTVIPAPPWQLAIFTCLTTAGDPGVWFATEGTANQVVFDVTTDSRYRIYTNFTTPTRLQTGPSIVTTTPCLLLIQADGVNANVFRNGASLVSGALAGNVAGIARFGSMNHATSGDNYNAPKGYHEFAALVPNTGSTFKTLMTNLMGERHASIAQGAYT